MELLPSQIGFVLKVGVQAAAMIRGECWRLAVCRDRPDNQHCGGRATLQ
jgi:hypothetical protein